jgi:hypothetical protein
MFILLIRINVCQTFWVHESCDKTDSPKHILENALENTFRIININGEYEIVWVWNKCSLIKILQTIHRLENLKIKSKISSI